MMLLFCSNGRMQNFETQPCGALRGKIRVPGDKSISHRAILLASIAIGTTHIEGFLFGADNLATLGAIQQLGVMLRVNRAKEHIAIEGKGLRGLTPAQAALDLGNSGTAMRLLTGLLAPQPFITTLVGDASLSKRPMARIVDPLQQMGAKISLSAQGTPPITIYGGESLHGIEYQLPVASAQVKSALLLAAIYAAGVTTIIETFPSRDHTERMLRAFCYPIECQANRIQLTGFHPLSSTHIKIPADISSAAFFMVAATLVPGSKIILKEVGVNPTRLGIINLLRAMGANIQLLNETTFGAEPVADIEVTAAPLVGIDIPEDQIPLAIDEMPILMIAAACAKGVTRLRKAAELRVKETDRIAAMIEGLQALGINCEPEPDGMTVEGGTLRGGRINSYGDHRIVMAFAVAGCVAQQPILIEDCHNVQTSFPSFVDLAAKVGMRIQVDLL